MALLIDKNGNEEEINYYELESRLEEIIKSLPESEYNQFLDFAANYQVFSPYFDYAILKLGYSIVNPMGYNGIIKCENGNMYLYKQVIRHQEELLDKVRIYPGDKDTIKVSPVPYDKEKMSSGVLDHYNNYYTIDNISSVHSAVPINIVNQIILKNKEMYELFKSYQPGFLREMSFLENCLGFVRISFSHDDDFMMTTYCGSKISSRQQDYMSYLKSIGLLESDFCLDREKYRYGSVKERSDKR